MAIEIWRQQTFALWIETTPGTTAATVAYIPVNSWKLKPTNTFIKDNSWFGIIDENSGEHIASKISEFTADGIARSHNIWWLLLLALWTAWTPALLETWVYNHTFTRLNNNTHPTATIYRNNGTIDYFSKYSMLESVDFTGAVGDYLKFNVATKGRSISGTTAPTLAFNTADEVFLVSNMQVKFASTLGWLAAATPVSVTNAKFTINKNLMQVFTSSVTTEALDFTTQHNQQFTVSWDFEVVYDTSWVAFESNYLNGTAKAMEINISWRALVGATLKNKLTFQFANTRQDTWDMTTDNNWVIKQTVWFTAIYDTTNTQTINATLQNSRATQYA